MNSPSLRSSALDEEVARAEMYGLLATLFYQPPAAELLAQLQAAVTEAPEAGGFLEEPWRELVAQARASDAPGLAQEYSALFGGVGKPEVYLFGSHYLSGFLNEKPLVQLRDDLAALGLARDAAMPETEDHVAYLLEVMRYLIAGDDPGVCNLTRQAEFFCPPHSTLAGVSVPGAGRPPAGEVLCPPGRAHRGFRQRGSPRF